MEPILPGRYVVAVNARSGPQLSSPYATTYFPGGNRTDARAIALGDGERQTGLTIVVTPLEDATVSGMVTFDDDRPVVGANVTAAPVDHKGRITSSATTDNSGAFQFRALAGVAYVIRAGTRTTDDSNRPRPCSSSAGSTTPSASRSAGEEVDDHGSGIRYRLRVVVVREKA